jgi:mono/diheme cytochrome c family protein
MSSSDFHGYRGTTLHPNISVLSFLSYRCKSVALRARPRALFGLGFVVTAAIITLMPHGLSAQSPQTTTKAGVYTIAQAERGRMTYALSCRSCHTAASHTGVTFAKLWKDRTVADLFAFMSTEMPKSDPGSLDPEQYADVLAYLLKLNAMPAGTTELLADSSALAQIRIELPPKRPTKPQKQTQTQTHKPTSKPRP